MESQVRRVSQVSQGSVDNQAPRERRVNLDQEVLKV
jgi:hypothetical protein